LETSEFISKIKLNIDKERRGIIAKIRKTILAVINIKNCFIFIVLVGQEVDALRKGRIEIYDRDL